MNNNLDKIQFIIFHHNNNLDNLHKIQFIIFHYNNNLDNLNKIQFIARIQLGNLVFIYFNDKA